MKKIFIAFILCLFSISFISCNHVNTKYICVDCNYKLKDISAETDSLAYYEAYQWNEISRCVETAMNNASRGTWLYNSSLKYKDYTFVLWKITYNDAFARKVKNNEIDFSEVIKNPEKYIEKYKLSLTQVIEYLSYDDINSFMDRLYKGEDCYYNEVYNNCKKMYK